MDIANLTPEELIALKAQLDGITDVSGRSPMRPRQLHDLRLLPQHDDPRPLFISSAEPPRDGRDLTKISEFPKLMFHKDTGKEITVHSSQEQRQMIDLYDLNRRPDIVLEPMEALKLELSSFSPEDLELILSTQLQSRIDAVQPKLAGLTRERLLQLLAEIESVEDPKAGKKKSA